MPLDPAVIVAAVRDYVARALAPLQAKIDMLIADPKIDIDKIIAEAKAQIPPPKFLCVSGSITAAEAQQLRKAWDEASSDADPVRWLPVPQDGRDAAQLEIVSAIDATKSYPRGTYATHNNGLWRAYEATEGMRGWECLVAGLAEIEVTFAHEREFQVSHTLSNGKKTCQTFEIPVSIYRGVFVEGREYHRGDAVSWGAHQWHCNEPTTEKPIEGGKAWTLSVKRGRDGKDGRDLTVKGKA